MWSNVGHKLLFLILKSYSSFFRIGHFGFLNFNSVKCFCHVIWLFWIRQSPIRSPHSFRNLFRALLFDHFLPISYNIPLFSSFIILFFTKCFLTLHFVIPKRYLQNIKYTFYICRFFVWLCHIPAYLFICLYNKHHTPFIVYRFVFEFPFEEPSRSSCGL